MKKNITYTAACAVSEDEILAKDQEKITTSENKQKKILTKEEKKNRNRHIAAVVITFAGNAILYLTLWLLSKYDHVYFDQILFQLKTTTEGVQGGLALSGVASVGLLSLGTTLVEVFLYLLLSGKLFGKLKAFFEKNRKYIDYCKSKSCRFFVKQALTLALLVFMVCVIVFITQLDVFAYVDTISTESDFIEEHYADPETTTLTFPKEKRNLIYIFLESIENTFADTTAGGNITVDYIPELTALAEENVSFSNTDTIGGAYAFAGTTWTASAMVSQTSGVTVKVPLGADVYGAEEDFMPGVYSIGEVLRDAGYNQTLLVGSVAEFHGRKAYFTQNGEYNIVDINSLKEEGRLDPDYEVWWGFEDEKLYQYAKEEILALAEQDEPFNFTMLTVDSHFPNGYVCESCGDEYEQQYANVLACSSRQLYEFVQWAKEQDFYENTTIVISGDHLTMDSEFLADIDPEYTRTVYNCIINSAVQPVQEKNREFGTYDMYPTTLAAMGVKIDGDRLGLGTNLFSDKKTLTEEFGFEKLDAELQLRSEFYNEHLLMMDDRTFFGKDETETGETK